MAHFRELINWGVQLTPSDLFMKSSAVMASIRYLPRDMASATPQEMAEADEALNRVLMRFEDRWSLWFECQRNYIRTYHYHEFKSPVARAIELDRQRYFSTPGNQFENMYVFSMMYKPNTGHVNRVASLYRGGPEADAWLAEYKVFINQFRSVLSTFKQFTHRAEVLEGAAFKTYLHNCVSIHQQNVKMSDLPDMSIAGALADCDFVGGSEPMLDKHHLRTIKISGQPREVYTSGILDIINSAPFPVRNVTRVQTKKTDDVLAEIDTTQSRWDAATSSIMSMVKKNREGKQDAFAALSSIGVNSASIAVKSGRTSFAWITPTFTVHDESLAEVERRCDWLTGVIRDAGFTCYVAGDFDAQPAYMSSLPGHGKPDVGKLNAATINIAKLVPSTAPWTGPAWDHKLDGPPLMRCCGLGNTVFRYVLHKPGSKAAHTIIDAGTGGGKSVLAGALAVGMGRYPRSNVVFIDFLASSKGVTLALEGTFYGFDAGKKVSLQPLRSVDVPSEKVWGAQFMCALFRHMKVELTTQQIQEINETLDIIKTRPPHRRTLTLFQALVQDEKLWTVLDLFVRGGAYGDLLDNDAHSLGGGESVRCYELAALLKNQDALGPVLYVIFHETQRQLNGDPMLLIVDEAQHLKRFKAFLENLEEYLETARKNNMTVVLITPNLKEFTADPKLSALIGRSCKNRIFGKNNSAMSNVEDKAAYKSFGLSDERIEVISKLKTATDEDPSHFYTFSHEDGSWALFDMKLSPMQLAFLGRNDPKDKEAMDRILEAGPREEYPQRWLRHCGFTDEQIIEFGFAWKPQTDYYAEIAAE